MPAEGTIIAIGLPGKGKSTVLSTIAKGSPDSKLFPSGKSARAFTKEIQCSEETIEVPGVEPLPLRIFDIPGILDGQIKMHQWESMMTKSLTGVEIDLVLVVVSAHDRVDVGNVMMGVALRFFFDTFDLKRCCLVVTHCDQLDDDDTVDGEGNALARTYVTEWLQELRKCTKADVCRSSMCFAKKRAKNGSLGFHGQRSHVEEVRHAIINLVRDNKITGVSMTAEVTTKAKVKKPDPKEVYKALSEVIEPGPLRKALDKAGLGDCCIMQ